MAVSLVLDVQHSVVHITSCRPPYRTNFLLRCVVNRGEHAVVYVHGVRWALQIRHSDPVIPIYKHNLYETSLHSCKAIHGD